MSLADRGCVFLGLILYISAVQANSVCALKGSSVHLRCSAQHPTSNMKWFSEHRVGTELDHREISADGKHIISAESPPTLTISDLRESDGNFYCCSDENHLNDCQKGGIQLQVADLQVKVFPATEADTVSLMCSSSCPLTDSPALYVWYKDRASLYEDWSPWYQQLLSGEEAGNYSCAVKGYEHLRAKVSVDSVTPSCFTVTYAEGRMCSHQHNSGPCSITYPREVHVQKSETAVTGHFKLTCTTNCSLTDSQTSFTWYKNRRNKKQLPSLVPSSSPDSFSCAVRGHEDLLSDEICIDDENCQRVNYVSWRICALKGSSVNISSEYWYPDTHGLKAKYWYKKERNATAAAEELKETAPRIKYHDGTKNRHILTINELNKNDSAEYIFKIIADHQTGKQLDLPGVTLVVTDLRVRFTPSAAVTEGQRVTLTCGTSCPLTDDTNYIWYLNSRPLDLTKRQSKHLVLDLVSGEHEGNYSCAVENRQMRSLEKMLTVHTRRRWAPAAAGVVAVLLVIISIAVFLRIRRKMKSSRSPGTESSDNLEQMIPGHVYDVISAQPAEQEVLYESIVDLSNHTDALYSKVQLHQAQVQEHIPYAVVNLKPKTTRESNCYANDSGFGKKFNAAEVHNHY